ncbi:MAG: hypothetical protein ACUVR4_02310 [Anaerolineae bacterium]
MMPIRPFGLSDIWLVRRLQHSGITLAIEHALTHPHQPLWTALTAPWPWAGIGVATFVLDKTVDGRRLVGFVQMMKRAARPEADLLHIAPAVSVAEGGYPDAERIWQQLLQHCALAASGHGLQRIFASTPTNCPEQTSLKAAGFSLYTRETIYRLERALPGDGPAAGFREQLPQDSWALQRLYMRNTPRLVQQAEGAANGEVGSPMLSWWEPGSWRGLVWEPAGQVRGAVQMHVGRTGHWLRIWGANELAARELRGLVAQGLSQLATVSRRRRSLPVYTTVRDYEIDLVGTLIGFGFAPFMDRARFVRHVQATARVPQPVPLTVLEIRQEMPVRMRAHSSDYEG